MTIEPDPQHRTFSTTQTAVDADGRPIAVQPVAATPVAPVVERVVVPQVAMHESVATSYGRRYALDSVWPLYNYAAMWAIPTLARLNISWMRRPGSFILWR